MSSSMAITDSLSSAGLDSSVQQFDTICSKDQPFASTLGCRNTQGTIQEIPHLIRVSYDNIVVNKHALKVEIKGMTGPHASKINGIYTPIAASLEDSPRDQFVSSSVADDAVFAKTFVSKPGSLIRMIGASGPSADFVNGFYEAVDELSQNHRVYIKCNDNRICIHFWEGIWSISGVQNKGKNNSGTAILRCAHPLESTGSTLHSWEVVDSNSMLESQPNVRCAFGEQLTGDRPQRNFFEALKKIDGDVWLQHRAGKFSVCDGQDRFSDEGYIFCDIHGDICKGDLVDFQLFCTPWMAQQPWYSIQPHPKSSNSSESNVAVFHSDVSAKCNPSFAFTGMYRAAHMPGCSMPAYLLLDDSHLIEYCQEHAVWVLKHSSSNQIMASSCAVSPGFPVPVLWTPSQEMLGQYSASLSPSSSVDLATTPFHFADFPLVMFIVAVNAGTDAALFEGSYELTDILPCQRKCALNVLYSNAKSGFQLRFDISNRIESAIFAVDGEVLFQSCDSMSDEEKLVLFSSLFTDVSNFSIDLFRIANPLSSGFAPAFKVILSKPDSLPSANSAFQTRMMPMLLHPSCANVVKELMRTSSFDAAGFWNSVLHQMSGQSEVADSAAIHRVLEFSQSLSESQSSSDASTFLPSVYELRYSIAFQRYLEFNLVAGIARSVMDFVNLFVTLINDSRLNDSVSKNHQFSHFNLLLQRQSSKLVSQYLQGLGRMSFHFIRFMARAITERCQASLSIDNIGVHEILSPVCLALHRIFDLDERTCIRLQSCVMKTRKIVLQRTSHLTLVSESLLLRLTPAASKLPLECDLRCIIQIIRALIVSAADGQSLITDALQFELHQLFYTFGDSIEHAYSTEQPATSVIFKTLSADPAFTRLSAEQIIQTSFLILKEMISSFQKHQMDVPRCTDLLSMILASVIVNVLLHSNTDAVCPAQLFESSPSLSKWVSLFANNYLSLKYLESVPVSFSHSRVSYVRCVAPSSMSPTGSAAKVIEMPNHKLESQSLHFHNFQCTLEELLWKSIVVHQPLHVDPITSDMLERCSVTELQKCIESASSLQTRIKESLSRSKCKYSVMMQGACGWMVDRINGIYRATDELVNGKTLYIRADDKCCIYFAEVPGYYSMWCVSSIENKGKNTGYSASFVHNGPLEGLFLKSGWGLREGYGYRWDQSDIRVSFLSDDCSVSGSEIPAADAAAPADSCASSSPEPIPLVGAVCHVCRGSCEAFFYWAPSDGTHICLRCTIDMHLPTESLSNIRLSLVFSKSLTEPVFRKACLHALSTLFQSKTLTSDGMGSSAVIRVAQKECDLPAAVTWAPNSIIDRSSANQQLTDSSALVAPCSLDSAYAWMLSATQEVAHVMLLSAFDESSIVAWFDQAMCTVLALVGIKPEQASKSLLKTQSKHSKFSIEAKTKALIQSMNEAFMFDQPDVDDDYANHEIPVNGHGKFLFSDGRKYIGHWENRKPHGKGAVIFLNGDRYEGDFIGGMRHGKGVYLYADGSFYEGDYKDGVKHGKGTQKMSDGTFYIGQFDEGERRGRGVIHFANGDSYNGHFQEGRYHGRGVLVHAVDSVTTVYSESYSWNAGDTFDGEFKLGVRHGACRYTFFNGSTLDCTWKDGCCPEFAVRQKAVLAAVAESKHDHQISTLARFCIARNALLVAAVNNTSTRSALHLQLLPSVLKMCDDAVSFAAICSFDAASSPNMYSATFRHFLICDAVATGVCIAEIHSSISGCVIEFIQGNLPRALKLYVGLHASFNSLWEHLMNTSQLENHPTMPNTLSMYMSHADFIQSTVRTELLGLIASAPHAEFIETICAICKTGKIMDATLLHLFTTPAEIRWEMAAWITRVIPVDDPSSVEKDLHQFMLTICGLHAEQDDLKCIRKKSETGMLFLQDLHVAYFQSCTRDPFSIKSWSSVSKFIDTVLKNHDRSISSSLFESLIEIRANAHQYALPKISELSRFRLFESMIEVLLTFADDLGRSSAENWRQNEKFASYIDVLAPWASCIHGLSFNHAAVTSSVIRHLGPSYTKGLALSFFLKSMFRIDSMLIHMWEFKKDNASKTTVFDPVLMQCTDLLNAARSCFQRLSVAILHENMALAIDITIEHHDNACILIIVGALLSYIRSELLPPHQLQLVCIASPESHAIECSLCGASFVGSFHTHAASNYRECPSCHDRRTGQRLPMRVCDILAEYALRILRGDIDACTDHCRSLLHVFEMVYSKGQFSLSKAAVMCISNLSERWLPQNPRRNRFCTIKIPRWAAHALFPEYSSALLLQCGDAFAAPCAASLGWWIDTSGSRRSVHDLVMHHFSLQSSSIKDEDRLPFGSAFSKACIMLLAMMHADGSVSETHAVAALLQQGISIENVGACITHMICSSLLVASDGRLWISSPHQQKYFREVSHDQSVGIPLDYQACTLVQFDDLAVAPLPHNASCHVAFAVSQSTLEQALVDGVQFVLEHAPGICCDLLRLSSALRGNHGNFPRSLIALMSDRALTQDEIQEKEERDGVSLCPVCNEDPIGVRNSCGHGLCPNCWTEFVANAVHSSSTPEIAKGNGDEGSTSVLDIKCPGDADAKCRCPVQFSVLKRALPKGIENLIRTVMRSMSRVFLSGAAAIAQCICGAVACSTIISSEVECKCGHVQCIGDMKRGTTRASYVPHPHLSSDDEQSWLQMNIEGSELRSMIMRCKHCPKCGVMTMKCGCEGSIVCTGMDKCPKEACDHMVCAKCGTDWCWICRRIGSVETRCSLPESGRKDTKELLLRAGTQVRALEKTLNEMGLTSWFRELQLKDNGAGVISLKLNRSVLSISGVPVKSIGKCQQVLKAMDSQTIVIETADLTATAHPCGWMEKEHNGRKYFCNSKLGVTQWECPCPQEVPRSQREVQVMQAPGFLAGTKMLPDVFAADEIVRQRMKQILSVTSAMPRDAAIENVQDAHDTFNFLFVNVSNACSDLSLDQLIEVTRHIMANNCDDVISALSVTRLSTAAFKSLKRFAKLARSTLQIQ